MLTHVYTYMPIYLYLDIYTYLHSILRYNTPDIF